MNPDETVVFLCSGSHDMMFEELQKSFLNTHRIKDFTNDSSAMESYLRDPRGILLVDLESFHGAQARNTVIFLLANTDEQVVYDIIKNALMRTMSFTIIITSEEQEYRPVVGVAEDLDLHEYIYSNSFKPICHYIEIDPEFDAKSITDQIFDRLVISEGTVLVLVGYSKDAKRIRNVLRKRIASKKKIVIVTYRENYVDGRYYAKRLSKHLEMKDSIVITRINPFANDFLPIENTSPISSLARYVIILESGENQIEDESYKLRNMCLNIKSKIVVTSTANRIDLYRPFFEMVNISEIKQQD